MKKVGFTLPQEKNSIFSLPGRKKISEKSKKKKSHHNKKTKIPIFLAQTFARLA